MAEKSTALIRVDRTGISDLGKVLIEKISDGIGGIAKPFQIKRISRAEAEAEIVKAKARIKIGALERRALGRFLSEETSKQANMEAVIQKALPQLSETATPREIGDDWIVNFFDKCRLVSDQDMQALWSRLLAGEANSPGAYSKRTVNVLQSIDKKDAELFTNLCRFGWQISGILWPLIFDFQNPIYTDLGISFTACMNLDSVGLIRFEDFAGVSLSNFPRRDRVSYHGTPIEIELQKESDNALDLGKVVLSQSGQELAKICGAHPIPGFLDYVIGNWLRAGIVCSSPYPRDRA